jgi:hypothetical protein
VSRFYKRALTKGLEEALSEHLEQKPSEQLNLLEELALMREAASGHVRVYSAALDTGKQETILAAGELMAISMQRVADMCKSAATVAGAQDDKLTAQDVAYVIEQIIRISHDCFKDDDLVNLFASRIRTELQLKEKDRGTSITPDQEVIEMDRLTLGDVP